MTNHLIYSKINFFLFFKFPFYTINRGVWARRMSMTTYTRRNTDTTGELLLSYGQQSARAFSEGNTG